MKLKKVGTFRKGTWWGEVRELYIVVDSSRGARVSAYPVRAPTGGALTVLCNIFVNNHVAIHLSGIVE